MKKLLIAAMTICLALFVMTGCLEEYSSIDVTEAKLLDSKTVQVTMAEQEGLTFTWNGTEVAGTYEQGAYTIAVPTVDRVANVLKLSAEFYSDTSINLNVTENVGDIVLTKTAEEFFAALTESAEGSVIFAPDAEIAQDVTVAKTLVINGQTNTKFTGAVSVTADDVVFNRVTVSHTYVDRTESTLFQISGVNFAVNNSIVERTSTASRSYGWIIEYSAASGKLTATGTTFKAPYNPDEAFVSSPSMVYCQNAEIDFDGCTFATNGYAFFDVWVTKGVVKNSKFCGLDEKPIYSAINSMHLNGLQIVGNTFEGNRQEPALIVAGEFTVEGNTFIVIKEGSSCIQIYGNTGDVKILNNTFNFQAEGKGISLVYPTWESNPDCMTKQPEKITIEGNKFVGTAIYAVRNVTTYWHNAGTLTIGENEWNGNAVQNEVLAN